MNKLTQEMETESPCHVNTRDVMMREFGCAIISNEIIPITTDIEGNRENINIFLFEI